MPQQHSCPTQHRDNEESLSAPRRAKLATAGVTPLRHGPHCPGLSGIFSIVNGIRLTLGLRHQFSDRDSVALVETGLRFLNGRVTPERAVTCGLPSGLWLRLAEGLTNRVRERTGLFVSVEREYPSDSNWASAQATIEQAIERRRPLLTLMRGGRYTAVSGFTAHSLLLFDSGGAQWILKSAIGIAGNGDDAKHILYPKTFISFRT